MNRPHSHAKLAVFLLAVLPQLAVAQYVELTARLETLNWSNDGVTQGEPWEVHCVVGTNSWRMDGEFLEFAKSTAWFTGSNIIVSDDLSKPVVQNQRLADYTDGAGRFLQVATSSGQRWTRILQSVDGNPSRPARQLDLLTMQGRIAWLAFCSGPCLKHKGHKLYPPRDLWKEVVSAPAGFSERTVVFQDGLGLPKSVRLETPRHFPILQYGVVSSTNVCGWEFPREFYLAQYRPGISWDSGQIGPGGWEVDFIVRGRVIAIGAGTKPEISPEVIVDLRK